MTSNSPAQTSGSHLPCWFSDSQIPKFSSLKENIESDVCIIGGGFAGITTAYLLAKKGKSVVLLEDGEIASGESGRTTAQLLIDQDDRIAHIVSQHSKDVGKTVIESHSQAIDLMESICQTEGIDADFQRLDFWLFNPKSAQDTSSLQKELEITRELGLKGVDVMDRAPIKTFDTGPALRFQNHAQLHPLKYLGGLAKAAERLGCKIYTNTHAQEFGARSNALCESVTREGYKVMSKALVMATNVPLNNYLTVHAKQEPYRSYVIAAPIPKKDFHLAIYNDTENPYHYVRVTNHDEENYLLLTGGEDHKVGMEMDLKGDKMKERYDNLEKWTRERWPTLGQVAYRWSGQVVETIDSVQNYGRNPGDYENVYICTGDSGNGVTGATVGAMLISDLIVNSESNWKDCYDPARIRVKALPEMLKHDLEVNLQFKDYISPSDVSDIEDIPKCSGAVMRCGIHRVAVYRDENGVIHQHTAVCPHLKGVVRWNNDEKSWDCPVHGSRFDKHGAVIIGPSKSDLEKTDYKLNSRTIKF